MNTSRGFLLIWPFIDLYHQWWDITFTISSEIKHQHLLYTFFLFNPLCNLIFNSKFASIDTGTKFCPFPVQGLFYPSSEQNLTVTVLLNLMLVVLMFSSSHPHQALVNWTITFKCLLHNLMTILRKDISFMACV